jgi:hypothetical protein
VLIFAAVTANFLGANKSRVAIVVLLVVLNWFVHKVYWSE